MRANEIRLYDLEAVTTTIVLREIQPNPDVITIGLYDLDPVTTTIVLRQTPPAFSSGGAVSVETLTGELTLTGFSPSIARGVFTGLGELVLIGHAPTIDISGGGSPPETETGIIATMFYAEKRRLTKKVKC